MKKIFENFYLFSKLALSLSFTNLSFRGFVYNLYQLSKKESKISENQIKLERNIDS